MYGLNIHLQSFRIRPDLIGPNNDIRVSITTIPDDTKLAFVINEQKTNEAHHFFAVNISPRTMKIIFVFRKKSFSQNDPIIASTIIHSNEFPKPNDLTNTEIKEFKLYEPLCNIKKLGYKSPNGEKRFVFGEMKIQMTPAEAFPVSLFDDSYKSQNTYNRTAFSHHNKKPVRVDENQNVIFNKNWVFN